MFYQLQTLDFQKHTWNLPSGSKKVPHQECSEQQLPQHGSVWTWGHHAGGETCTVPGKGSTSHRTLTANRTSRQQVSNEFHTSWTMPMSLFWTLAFDSRSPHGGLFPSQKTHRYSSVHSGGLEHTFRGLQSLQNTTVVSPCSQNGCDCVILQMLMVRNFRGTGRGIPRVFSKVQSLNLTKHQKFSKSVHKRKR